MSRGRAQACASQPVARSRLFAASAPAVAHTRVVTGRPRHTRSSGDVSPGGRSACSTVPAAWSAARPTLSITGLCPACRRANTASSSRVASQAARNRTPAWPAARVRGPGGPWRATLMAWYTSASPASTGPSDVGPTAWDTPRKGPAAAADLRVARSTSKARRFDSPARGRHRRRGRGACRVWNGRSEGATAVRRMLVRCAQTGKGMGGGQRCRITPSLHGRDVIRLRHREHRHHIRVASSLRR